MVKQAELLIYRKGNNQVTEKQIREVFSNEEFMKEVLTKETPEEVQEMFEKRNVEISIAEILKIKEILLEKLTQSENCFEMNEDELQEVSGGELILGCAIFLTVLIGGASIGATFCIDKITGSRW